MKHFYVLFLALIFVVGAVYASTTTELQQRREALTAEINQLRQQISAAGARGDIAEVKKIQEKHNALVKERYQLDNKIRLPYGQGSYGKDQTARIDFFNKMKTCQPASVQSLVFTETVLGKKNGYCYFKFALNSGKARTECRFPMSIAQKYASESIKGINQGVDLSSTRAIINNPEYCKDYLNN